MLLSVVVVERIERLRSLEVVEDGPEEGFGAMVGGDVDGYKEVEEV